jgi:geranylgeranyl pyrophosphate synthase/predicted secreted hydrolase
VPGPWTLQVWYNGQKYAEQVFTIAQPQQNRWDANVPATLDNLSTTIDLVPPTAPALDAARAASEKRAVVPCERPAFQRPADWPGKGPIDLSVHDRPHASSALEWWYVNAHFRTESGRKLAAFAAFFREISNRHQSSGEPVYAHSIIWALSDPGHRRYYPRCAVDCAAPALGLKKLDRGAGAEDERLNRAMREVLGRNRIPLPTRMFDGTALVPADRLALDYAGDRYEKRADGSYELRLFDPHSRVRCDLALTPQKPPIRHGNEGRIHGVAGEMMFYYFIPRCKLTGSVTVDGKYENIANGSAWYDHEFGVLPQTLDGAAKPETKGGRTTWNWASIQLEDGVDVTVYSIRCAGTGEALDNWAIISDPRGRRKQYGKCSLRPDATWTSTRSFVEYPIAWTLEVPEAKLELTIEATFADQEVLTVISDPGFWEGQVNVAGTFRGTPVSGQGWVERKGFRFDQLDDFLKAAGREVRKQVAKVLPLDPDPRQMQSLVVRSVGPAYLDGLDRKQFARTLVQPVREIIDRGGKSWRSYAALSCIEVVGGDSRNFLHWLAMPEILHVGSLIVDDVEDGSEVRRGGPAAHMICGEPLAINAGSAAYFIAEPPIKHDPLPPETKLRVYELYFDAMRAGHAGQAIDIDGLYGFLPAAVESGDAADLQRRVLAVHRLKTAAPVGMAARIGALLGGGSEVQIDALGTFFEAIGLAFQIIDDVLNLRGFEGGLKAKGEDIQHGKVTLPIAKALELLPRADRQWLFKTLSSKPEDAATVDKVIAKLDSVDAIDVCARQARDLVENAWARLDPLIEDSQYKVVFRAFGWYVLERHY